MKISLKCHPRMSPCQRARRLTRSLPFVVAAAIAVPGVARAQEAPPPPPPVVTQETTSQARGPSMAMVGSGVVIFGLSYVPAVIAGSVSNLPADRTLFVPIAGPWIDLTQRPGCPASSSSCNAETTNKVLLVTDGVFQAVGALTVLGGFLTTAHETTTVQRAAALHPALKLSPASIGAGGYGMVAVGAF
jgi:hypothetical protein